MSDAADCDDAAIIERQNIYAHNDAMNTPQFSTHIPEEWDWVKYRMPLSDAPLEGIYWLLRWPA